MAEPVCASDLFIEALLEAKRSGKNMVRVYREKTDGE